MSTRREAGGPLLMVVLGGLSAFGPLAMDLYLPALPALARDLGTSASLAQLSLTTCVLGLAVGQIVAGPLSDARGRRPVLIVGLLAFAATSAVCAVAPGIGVLLLARFLQGAGGAFGIVVARAIVRDVWSGAQLARAFSRLIAVMGVAPVIAPLLGGQVLAFTSWRGTFVVLGAIGLLILLATVVVVPETHPAHARATGGMGAARAAYVRLLGDRAFLAYALAGGLGIAAMFAYIAGSSFVLQDVYGVSPTVFSIVFAVNAAGIIVLGQVNSMLVGRLGSRVLLGRGLMLLAFGAVMTLVVVAAGGLGLGVLLVALFLTVAPVGLVIPNSTALAMTGYADAAGAASALLGALQFVLGGLVSPLVGIAGSATALPMACVMAVAGVAAIGVLRALEPRGVPVAV